MLILKKVISCILLLFFYDHVIMSLFFPVIKTSNNYRLMAEVGTDPKTQDVKFHLRYYWNWNDDEDFQAKVKKGSVAQISSDEPMWKSTKRGIALNLEDLKEFLGSF